MNHRDSVVLLAVSHGGCRYFGPYKSERYGRGRLIQIHIRDITSRRLTSARSEDGTLKKCVSTLPEPRLIVVNCVTLQTTGAKTVSKGLLYYV